jgi:uncharacterized MAPEG superfamily protein
MTTSYGCILAAGLLPFVATSLAKAGARFDNHNPRDWLARQEGWRRRANAAQANSFEAFPLFAVAVLVAHQTHAPMGRVDALALAFVGLRIGYLVAYLADVAALRSALWMGALGCCVALFFQGV